MTAALCHFIYLLAKERLRKGLGVTYETGAPCAHRPTLDALSSDFQSMDDGIPE